KNALAILPSYVFPKPDFRTSTKRPIWSQNFSCTSFLNAISLHHEPYSDIQLIRYGQIGLKTFNPSAQAQYNQLHILCNNLTRFHNLQVIHGTWVGMA
ncbi:hypothetical protein TNCT_118731, partial [Trichonephila clavata]